MSDFHAPVALERARRPDLRWLHHEDALVRHQQRELTGTMLRFDNETHVLRVVADQGGFLTVTVRAREPNAATHTFRFPKTHRGLRGPRRAVYTFWKADRLLDLAVEPSERVDSAAVVA